MNALLLIGMRSELFLGIFLSFTAAVAVHYLLEKFYLEWSKQTIIGIVVALLLICLGLHLKLGIASKNDNSHV